MRLKPNCNFFLTFSEKTLGFSLKIDNLQLRYLRLSCGDMLQKQRIKSTKLKSFKDK